MLCAWGSSVSDILIPYALKDGALIHVSKVESGLACDCICPSCHERFVARKGGFRVHHFAHLSGESCSGALESTLHIFAKEILSEEKRITLPAVSIELSSDRRPLVLADSKTYEVDSVREEKKLGDIKPDLILKIGQRELLVEVYVTHKVDNLKIETIKELGLSAIEINLSTSPRHMPKETLSELIVNGVDNKRWLNNEWVRQEHQKLMEKTVRKEIVRSGQFVPYLKVEKCPRKMHKWNGRDVMHHILDCLWCEYCLGIEPNSSSTNEITHIYCIGHIQDLFSASGTDI